jgi:hypothetical protein
MNVQRRLLYPRPRSVGLFKVIAPFVRQFQRLPRTARILESRIERIEKALIALFSGFYHGFP